VLARFTVGRTRERFESLYEEYLGPAGGKPEHGVRESGPDAGLRCGVPYRFASPMGKGTVPWMA